AALGGAVRPGEASGREQDLLADPVVHATDVEQPGPQQAPAVPSARGDQRGEPPGHAQLHECAPVDLVQLGVLASWRLSLSHDWEIVHGTTRRAWRAARRDPRRTRG